MELEPYKLVLFYHKRDWFLPVSPYVMVGHKVRCEKCTEHLYAWWNGCCVWFEQFSIYGSPLKRNIKKWVIIIDFPCMTFMEELGLLCVLHSWHYLCWYRQGRAAPYTPLCCQKARTSFWRRCPSAVFPACPQTASCLLRGRRSAGWEGREEGMTLKKG